MDEFNDSLHILDIYRKSLLLAGEPRGKKQKDRGGDDIIRSATELKEAGIRIERSKSRSLMDISFHGGVLKLPLIVVDDALESRFHVGAGNDVTSYVFFMDNLVLHSRGIIQNALGSDKAVANLFNSLSKDFTLDPESAFNQVHKQLSAYCQKPWSQWRAELEHTFFTDPWLISAITILLFVLTTFQTIFTVLAYFKHP